MQEAMASIGHPEYRWTPGIPDERGVSHDFMLYQGPSTPLYLRVEECEAVRRAYINCLPSFIYQETDEGPIGASAQQAVRLAEKANSIVRSKSTLTSNWYDFYDTMMPRGVVCKKPISHSGAINSAVNFMHNKYFSQERSRTSASIKYSLTVPGQTGKRIAVAPEKFQTALDDATARGWDNWNEETDPKFRAANPSLQQFRQDTEAQLRAFYVPGRQPTVDDFVAAMSKYMGERLKAYKATTPGRLKQAVWNAISKYAADETKIDLEAVSGYFLPADFTQFCIYAAGIILEYMGYSKGVKNQEASWVPHSAPMTILTSVDLTNWYAGR
jgi:hypothetical protein